jgi:hypothetical protein
LSFFLLQLFLKSSPESWCSFADIFILLGAQAAKDDASKLNGKWRGSLLAEDPIGLHARPGTDPYETSELPTHSSTSEEESVMPEEEPAEPEEEPWAPEGESLVPEEEPQKIEEEVRRTFAGFKQNKKKGLSSWAFEG